MSGRTDPLAAMFLPYRAQGILFDTNTLLVLLVAMLDSALVGRDRRTQAYGPPDGRLLLRIHALFARRFTTPGVLAECTNLIEPFCRKLGPNSRAALAELLRTEILSLEESYIPARDLIADPNLLQFGFTDAACAQIASAGCLVLTADLPLYLMLERRNLPVVNYHHISGWAE